MKATWCESDERAYRHALLENGLAIETTLSVAAAVDEAALESGREDLACVVRHGLFTDGPRSVVVIPRDPSVVLALHDFALTAASRGGGRKAKRAFADRIGQLVRFTAPPRRFRTILIDPPWMYQKFGSKGHGRADSHYKTMPIDRIRNLRIDLGWGPRRPVDLADPEGCALVLWATDVKTEDALALMREWGFPMTTKLFTWVKTKKSSKGVSCVKEGDLKMGLGRYTRSASEDCWIGKRGKVKVKRHDLLRVVFAPVSRHSAKPQVIYDRIEQLLPGPYLEVFSRNKRPGWCSYGNDPTVKGAVCVKADW